MTDNFDDFFADDDFDLDEPEFPTDDFDDLPDIDLDEGGASRPFILIASLLAVVFVILVAVVAAIVLGSGGGCDERCIQATEISGTNFAIQTGEAETATAQSIAATSTATAEIALQATQTFDAALQATSTRNAENTAIAATSTSTHFALYCADFKIRIFKYSSGYAATACVGGFRNDFKVLTTALIPSYL